MFNCPSKMNQMKYVEAKKIFYSNLFREDPFYNKINKNSNYNNKKFIEHVSIDDFSLEFDQRENFIDAKNQRKNNSYDLITTNFNQQTFDKKDFSFVFDKHNKKANFQYKSEDKNQENDDLHTNYNIDHNTHYTNNNTNSNIYCITNNNLKIKNDVFANQNTHSKNKNFVNLKKKNFSNISNKNNVLNTANKLAKTSRNFNTKNTNYDSFNSLVNKKYHCRSKSLNYIKEIESTEKKYKSKFFKSEHEKSFESKINSLNEIKYKINHEESINGKLDLNFYDMPFNIIKYLKIIFKNLGKYWRILNLILLMKFQLILKSM